jgi:hypothetical protein
MNLEMEISCLKRAINELVDAVDKLSRKQVELRSMEKVALMKKEPSPPVLVTPVQDQRVWVRIGDICRSKRNPNSLLPISRSTWYKGVVSGEFPAPKKFGRSSMWRLMDVLAFVRDYE